MRRGIINDGEKKLYLTIANYIASGKSLPSFSELTVIVGKLQGRHSRAISSPTNRRVQRLEAKGLLIKAGNGHLMKILLMEIPPEYQGDFSMEELLAVKLAIAVQSNSLDLMMPQAPAFSLWDKPQSSAVEQKKTQGYDDYVSNLVIDATRLAVLSNGDNRYSDARFQLALIHFEDWERLAVIESAVDFSGKTFSRLTNQNVYDGLVWLNDAAGFGHEEVAEYLNRLASVVVPKSFSHFNHDSLFEMLQHFELKHLLSLVVPATATSQNSS